MKKETIRKVAKTTFTFWNTFCFTFCIYNSTKRKFILLVSKMINKKLSVENILTLSNNIEMLKEFCLNEEELISFNDLPAMSLEKQLRQAQIDD